MVLWSLLISQDEPMEPLAGEISGDAEAVGPLLSYRRFLEKAALSQRARQRLEKLMPQLLARLAKNPLPYRPLNHVLDLVRAISRRSAYLVLLSENPAVMDRLLTLFAQSDWIAEQVIRYPLLLDELLDPGLAEDLPRREELAESLARSVRLDHDDGQQLMAMNEFKLGTLLRIAIAQLEQRIDICTAQQLLTELAEILIERALQLAAAALSDRFPDAGKIEFGIIAYGTLGARELGYQSDLDLIFLYQQENPSAWSADNEKYAIRLSQRLLTYLASQTTSGALYTVDTRLRPNGGSGSLVSSLQAFKDYQSNDSWTWEQQALTRARWIAGSAAVLPAFEEIRQSVCGSPRQPDELKREIIAMRSRIRKEKSIVGTHDVDFKHGQGGLLDIEFICQYGVLLKSVESPALLGTTNTLGQINLLQSAGFLQPDDAEALAAAWLTYSHARHFVALTNFRASASFSPHMDFVGGLWSRLFDAEERAPAAQ
jgi:glutamate-ammonia-ligase adenylyltransferase